MSEPTLDVSITQVEIALEEGDLDTAERLLSAALPRFGRRPELEALAARIREVKHLAQRPTIDSLVKQSQERIRAADYEGALSPLRRAAAMAPDDTALQGLLAQTEKAAARHAAAVDRQNAVEAAARDIDGLIGSGDVAGARARLEQARSELGRHQIFDQAEQSLESLLRDSRQAEVDRHVARARQLRTTRDWQGVLSQAEAALSLDPDQVEAGRLKAEAEQALVLADNQRRLQDSVDSVARDVARLIDAGELRRAEQRLAEAGEQLGKHEIFDALAGRLDQKKKTKDVERKSEWAERRSREAESLLQQAVRAALGGHYEEALAKLDAAQQMDPNLEDIEGRRRDYRAAWQRQKAQEERAAALDSAVQGIRVALDGLHLDQAQRLLQQAQRRFTEPSDGERLRLLEQRLAGLRQEHEGAGEKPTPDSVGRLGLATKQAMRRRETALARAYSWKQAVLEPFRRPKALAACVAASALVSLGAAFLGPVLLLLLLVGAGLSAPSFIAKTLDPEETSAIGGAGHWLGRFLQALSLASLLLLPFLPSAFGSLGGLWAVAAPLLWIAVVLWCVAVGVGSAFGSAHSRRFLRHAVVLAGSRDGRGPADPTFWWVTNVVFVWAALAVLLRVYLVTSVPAMGIPLSALWEGYGLLLASHWIGLTIRGRRLDWATAYA